MLYLVETALAVYNAGWQSPLTFTTEYKRTHWSFNKKYPWILGNGSQEWNDLLHSTPNLISHLVPPHMISQIGHNWLSQTILSGVRGMCVVATPNPNTWKTSVSEIKSNRQHKMWFWKGRNKDLINIKCSSFFLKKKSFYTACMPIHNSNIFFLKYLFSGGQHPKTWYLYLIVSVFYLFNDPRFLCLLPWKKKWQFYTTMSTCDWALWLGRNFNSMDTHVSKQGLKTEHRRELRLSIRAQSLSPGKSPRTHLRRGHTGTWW